MQEAHPSLPEFDYIKPKTLAEASEFLAAHGNEARPLLGGTDIFVRLRDGIWKDKYLVDVKGLDGAKDITFNPSVGLVIGAAVTMNQVATFPAVKEHYPVLGEAANQVASYQLRNRATIVGNICNASPAGDTIGACILLGGSLNVHGTDGTRQEPLDTFFQGPGKTALKPGDVVTSLHLPIPPKGMVGKYKKLGRNKASDLSIVGLTVVGFPDGGVSSGYRIKLALASVAPIPLVVGDVEQILSDEAITGESIARAAQAAMETCTPIDDVRASARYRKAMVKNLSQKTMTEIWKELEGKSK